MQYRRLRAPRQHGQTLIDPPLAAAPQLVARNVALRRDYQYDLQGQPLVEVARQARRDFLDQARRYTAAYRPLDDPPADADAPILLAGHQPELFHAGVWFKNFALSQVGRQVGGQAVNLLIDNDTIAAAAIRVPCGSVERPAVRWVEYDGAGPELPYEERRILDAARFASFADRVAETISPLVERPLIRRFWPRSAPPTAAAGNLGQAVAAARHLLEGEWGARTLEVPLSHVCVLPAFRRFVAHLLAHRVRFGQIYNASLLEYRRLNRVRSRTHPVPELAAREGWQEIPFWIWSVERPQRRRLYARRRGVDLELADLESWQRTGPPLAEDRDAGEALQFLADLEAGGIKLRPRALMTTMFARLVIGDLFFHGVGGAKYDQLTDSLVSRFFGLTAPRYQLLTATAHLPIPRPPASEDDLRETERQLRELEFQPERHLAITDETGPLIAEKHRWIAETGRDAALRHQHITRLNHALQEFVGERRRQLAARRQQLVDVLANEKVLGSREYSFCLFPEETLRPFLLDI